MLLRRIESLLANSAAPSCCLSREATSSLVRMEKRAPRTGFGEMAPALRESSSLSRKGVRISYLFLQNRFIMSDTVHRECASTISYPLVCVLGRDGNTSKLQIRHRLDLHLPHPALAAFWVRQRAGRACARLSEWLGRRRHDQG